MTFLDKEKLYSLLKILILIIGRYKYGVKFYLLVFLEFLKLLHLILYLISLSARILFFVIFAIANAKEWRL